MHRAEPEATRSLSCRASFLIPIKMQQIGGEERIYEDTRAMKRGWVEQHAVRGLANTKRKEKKESKKKRREENETELKRNAIGNERATAERALSTKRIQIYPTRPGTVITCQKVAQVLVDTLRTSESKEASQVAGTLKNGTFTSQTSVTMRRAIRTSLSSHGWTEFSKYPTHNT